MLHCGSRALDLCMPKVMGVLNVTPDSFSDGGRYVDHEAALRRAEAMIAAGADLIDVGGESTRPGADPVETAEELRRVLPLVQELRQREVVVSVDTSKPEVMQACIDAGAHMVNDVYALRAPGALEVVADSNVAVCVMHMQGEPRSMQRDPRYTNVVVEVRDFLRRRVEACRTAGIDAARLLIDPGFGFGKTLEHNLALLRGLPMIGDDAPPLLVGLSRKSMLAALTQRAVGDRLAGSLALSIAAIEGGARIIRCHDVAETVDVIRVWSAFRGEPVSSQPGG